MSAYVKYSLHNKTTLLVLTDVYGWTSVQKALLVFKYRNSSAIILNEGLQDARFGVVKVVTLAAF